MRKESFPPCTCTKSLSLEREHTTWRSTLLPGTRGSPAACPFLFLKPSSREDVFEFLYVIALILARCVNKTIYHYQFICLGI